MIDICPAVPPATGFIGSMIGFVDCQAELLGSGGWQALATPGSTLTVVLTGFLTIFVALIGYNLLLGHGLSVRSATLSFVKIGAILALATSWPAYRTLVYDLVTDGPSQLVAEIGPRAGVTGADGTLIQRLDLADQAMTQLAILGPGNALSVRTQTPPSPFGGFDAFALGGSRILFELSAIGSMAAVRIIAGLMLALGPFFIAFMMFESSRGLFEGWVRVLGGAALGAIGVAIGLGLELALLEPWLGNALARRMAGEALPMMSTELFVISCLFSIIILAAIYASARVAGGFRLAPLLPALAGSSDALMASSGTAGTSRISGPRELADVERSRAAAVANLLLATSHTERSALSATIASRAVQGSKSSDRSQVHPGPATPVGRSFTRRPNSRFSGSASRRDAGA